MNTPEPCDRCANLYYNCLYKDDPSYTAECRLGYELLGCEGKQFKKREADNE